MMDQFALTKQEALKYISILMAVGAVISCISFITIGPLCKRFDERKIMIWGGFFLMVIGRFVFIPWGSEPPKIKYMDVNFDGDSPNSLGLFNQTDLLDYGNNDTSITLLEETGCPSSQTWCANTNALTIEQFLIGYTCTAIGYPIGATLIQTILSKVLGPRPQVSQNFSIIFLCIKKFIFDYSIGCLDGIIHWFRWIFSSSRSCTSKLYVHSTRNYMDIWIIRCSNDYYCYLAIKFKA